MEGPSARTGVFDLDAYLRDDDDGDDDIGGGGSCGGDATTVPLFSFVPPWLVLLLLAVLAAAFLLAIRASRDPVYTLSPSNCTKPDLYANASSWYLGKWHILYGRGACPTGASGLKTVYTKHGTPETFFTYTDCYTDWAGLDSRNNDAGYESHLEAAEWRWVAANGCALSAIMVLFLCIFLLLIVLSDVTHINGSSASGEISLLGLSVAAALLCLFSLLEVAATALVRHVPHADPRAWSAFFASCRVDVRTNSGYAYAKYSAWLSSAVLASSAAMCGYVVYCKPSEGQSGGPGDGDATAPHKRRHLVVATRLETPTAPLKR